MLYNDLTLLVVPGPLGLWPWSWPWRPASSTDTSSSRRTRDDVQSVIPYCINWSMTFISDTCNYSYNIYILTIKGVGISTQLLLEFHFCPWSWGYIGLDPVPPLWRLYLSFIFKYMSANRDTCWKKRNWKQKHIFEGFICMVPSGTRWENYRLMSLFW